VGLIAGSVFLTWLYNSSSDSLLMAAIWHGSFLFVTASNTPAGILPYLLVALSGLILLHTNPKHLISL
jgi:hypothetical protein